MSQSFPRKRILWSGAILHGIVNAVMTAQNSSYAYAENWFGSFYNIDTAGGAEGYISFEKGPWSCEGNMVGVFFDVHAAQRLFRRAGEEYNIERFFKGCPTLQRSWAEEKIMPQLRLEVCGKVRPRVTAVFWDEGEYLAAAEPWENVLANGAHIIENELIEDGEASLIAWLDAYGMSEEQLKFVRTLFERKLARPDAMIELSSAEVKWLESMFEDPRQKYLAIDQLMSKLPENERGNNDLSWLDSINPKNEFQKAMSICREKFQALGIVFPEVKSNPEGIIC